LMSYYEQMHTGFQVGFTPLPSHPGRPPAAPAVLYSLAISAGSKHPDAAWAFLKFTAGREGAVQLAQSGTLPMYAGDGVKEAWFARQPAPPAATESFFGTHWLVLRSDFDKGKPITQVQLLFNRVLAQSMDTDEALTLYHKEVNANQGGSSN
jgi:ABC-type glycerol-3-phosphate transport system substrate-binding protein